VLEPVERVLRVAEVPVERPVAQLEHVLHRRVLAAPPAPRAREAAVRVQFTQTPAFTKVRAIAKIFHNRKP
jgi:hypothetical protein